MKERLTYTNKNTNLSVPRKLLYDFYMNDNDFALLEEIVNKLGEYEQLEEDGLLIKLSKKPSHYDERLCSTCQSKEDCISGDYCLYCEED